MTSHAQAAAAAAVAEVKLVARHPNCASTFLFSVSNGAVQRGCEDDSPHVHVLHRRPTVGVREATKGIRLPHLRADSRLLRHVAVTSERAAVCFLYAWRFGFVRVV
jgi:hypothetical protein